MIPEALQVGHLHLDVLLPCVAGVGRPPARALLRWKAVWGRRTKATEQALSVLHAGWQVVHGTTDGTPAIAGPMLDGNVLDNFWGTLGNWAVFQDSAAPYALRAAREDGLVKTTLTTMGTNLSVDPALLPSGG
jgi:hypothetical protein